MKLNPRQRPHKPPILDRKSDQVILSVLSYSGDKKRQKVGKDSMKITKTREIFTNKFWISIVEV